MAESVTERSRLWILVFAAGASRRMRGVDKLMQPVGGQTLLVHAVRTALGTGQPVIVILPPGKPERAEALGALPVQTVLAAQAARGMSASIRAGIQALPDQAVGAMFLMADMPDLRCKDLTRLIDAFIGAGCSQVIRAAAADGTPGSPSVVPRRLFAAFKRLSGDQGGRAAMRDESPLLVPLPGHRAVTDLDTPEDWAHWRGVGPAPE